MRIKLKLLLIALTVALLGILIFMAVNIKQIKYENMYLAALKGSNLAGVSLSQLDDLNEEKILITTEITENAMLYHLNSSIDVTLKKTNYTYPFVCHFNMISGCFFTKTMQEQKSKSIVLNELTAFELFGATNITGEEIKIKHNNYTIVGVINDEDSENKNIYMPITLYSESPHTFITLLEPKSGISEEYAQNELKQIGVSELNYDFINLGNLSTLIYERAIIACMFITFLISILILKSNIKKLHNNCTEIKETLKQYYFKNLLLRKTKLIIKTIGNSLLITTSIAVTGWLGTYIAKTLLLWNQYTSSINPYQYNCFLNKTVHLHNIDIYSKIAFITFIIMLILTTLSLQEKK